MMNVETEKRKTSANGNVQKRDSPVNNGVGTKLGPKGIADDEFMAAAIGDVEWLKQSLRGNRGVINYDSNGLAPIHLSAIHGRLNCLKLLIEKMKIDVNLPSTTGWRPLHLSISNQTGKRSFQCLKYLLSRGADPSISNDDGIVPMHQAASEGHVQCLKALIEAEARIDDVDNQGQKPIDLAKLWGHKKCARILAAEMWHREKDFIAKEMKQLQKVKMHQVLKEIEDDEKFMSSQQFYGDKAFNEWMDKHGKPNKKDKGEEKKAEDKKSKGRVDLKTTPKDSLAKPNSVRPKVLQLSTKTSAEQNKPSLEPPSEARAGESLARDNLATSLPPTEEEGEVKKSVENEELFYNTTPWNKSTKESKKKYIKMLEDHYPRDMYTMAPKYPPKRERKPRLEADLAVAFNKNIDNKGNSRLAKIPQDVLDKMVKSSVKEREVVFKPKVIIDVQKRKHFDDDEKPAKPEAALHLCNDPHSPVFRAALRARQTPATPSTVSSVTSNSTTYSAQLSNEDVDGLLHLMSMMTKPTTFPSIIDHSTKSVKVSVN